MKIKKPHWFDEAGDLPTGIFELPSTKISHQDFILWWKDQVEPVNKILSEGVEVVATGAEFSWYGAAEVARVGYNYEPHHKALLINIQPVKKQLEKIAKGNRSSGPMETYRALKQLGEFK